MLETFGMMMAQFVALVVCFLVPLRIHIYQENIFQRRFLTTDGETDGFTLNLSPGQKLLKLC